MKTVIALIVALSSVSALACSQPLPATSVVTNLQRVLESEAFKKELKDQQGKDYSVQITGITFKKAFEVKLSNDCVISSKPLWDKPVAPGMCPRFKGVSSTTECK